MSPEVMAPDIETGLRDQCGGRWSMVVSNRIAMPATRSRHRGSCGDGLSRLCKCLCPEGQADGSPASVNEKLTALAVCSLPTRWLRGACYTKVELWFDYGRMVLAQSNLEIFKSIVERGFSREDLSVADEFCAERLLEHEYLAKMDLPGPDILKGPDRRRAEEH